MAVLHREQVFSDLFVAYLLARNIRYEEDLVDQLFQFQREAAGSCPSPAGALREGREIRSCNSQNQSGSSSRDGRHNSLAG